MSVQILHPAPENMMRELAIALGAESDYFLCCGSSISWQMDLSCMARELAIVEAEMYPRVPHSFQTLVHNYAISRLHIIDHSKYHDASKRVLLVNCLPSCQRVVYPTWKERLPSSINRGLDTPHLVVPASNTITHARQCHPQRQAM
jgi:hypothetical protein